MTTPSPKTVPTLVFVIVSRSYLHNLYGLMEIEKDADDDPTHMSLS
jgi:hypothetical protein